IIPIPEAINGAPVALGRPPGSGLAGAHLGRFVRWRGRRGQIGKKGPCGLRIAATLGKARGFQNAHMAIERDGDDIVQPHQLARFGESTAVAVAFTVAPRWTILVRAILMRRTRAMGTRLVAGGRGPLSGRALRGSCGSPFGGWLFRAAMMARFAMARTLRRT